MLERNPFVNRGPIVRAGQFFDRDETLQRVTMHLEEGQSCQVCGEHRIGRTSLLRYLAAEDGALSRPELWSSWPPDTRYIWVGVEFGGLPDLESGAARGAPLLTVWRFLAERLVLSLQRSGLSDEVSELRQFLDESVTDVDLRGRVRKVVMGLEQQVVFLMDDFDIVVERLEVDALERFQQAIRDLIIMPVRPALLITSTVDSLDRLIRHKYALADLPPQLSPLASVLAYVPLGLLDEAGARILCAADGLSDSGAPVFSADDEAFLLQLAGRHPDLLQVACFWLYELRGRPDARAVARERFACDRQVRPLMEYLWRRARGSDERQSSSELVGENLAAALVVLAEVGPGGPNRDSLSTVVLSELEERGLVCWRDGRPELFAEVFRDYVLEQAAGREGGDTNGVGDAAGASTVTVNGQTVELAPLEDRLYAFLESRLGETCRRAEIKAALWPNGAGVSDSALDQVLRRLRQKIEGDPRSPQVLVSVRGEGYKLTRTLR